MAEWSKAVVSSTTIFGFKGSNPFSTIEIIRTLNLRIINI